MPMYGTPRRGSVLMSGRDSGLILRSLASPFGEIVSWSICCTTLDASRSMPWESMSPGFSYPFLPKRHSFILLSPGRGAFRAGLDRHAAIHRKGDAGRERGLVGGEVDEQRDDVVGGAQPAHRLAGDEGLARLDRVGERVDAVLQRRRVDRPRAHRVAADALLHVVG